MRLMYYYLWPRELFALGLCNHDLWNKVISDKLLQLCMYHLLPLRLGKTNYLADFHDESKFVNRTELVEYVLDKTMDAGLMIDKTTSVEESQCIVRQGLLIGGAVTFPVSGTLFTYKLSIECSHDTLLEKNHALNWVKYILDRDALLSKYDDGWKTYRFIWDWLNFIGSYRNDVTFGVWRWTCKGHTKIRPIAGVGVTFTIPNDGRCSDVDAANRLNTRLEIRMTRLY